MLTGLSGPDVNVLPGEEHECTQAEGRRYIAAGLAEPIVAAKGAGAEKAVRKPRGEKRA
jgi:hypothetical protein